ncbi:MAG: DUF4349 domain-containing protein [Planctomycetota bacterium]|nr:DUF4349 domain-containing protein [Planctomycetota bacterium]
MDSAFRLSKDEQAVLDHVSGLTRVLPEPSDPVCADREIVGELVAMRSQLGAMAIHPPKMRLTFDDILAAAEQQPQSPTDNRVIYRLSSRWGIGLVTAASVALAFITGLIATAKPHIQYSAARGEPSLVMPDAVATSDEPLSQPEPAEAQIGDESPIDPGLYGSIVRQGSIHLRDGDPARIQRLVTELVTSSGGMVTNLTRQGTGEDVQVSLSVAVPADKYRDFKSKVAGFGEVLDETESTEDVTSDQVDLQARLTEAQDYLARLDKLIETPTDLSSLQNLERERRQTRLEIERYKRALQSLENRVALSRLDVQITTAAPAVAEPRGELAEAWHDGIEGLKGVSGFLLRAGLAGSPFLAMGAIAFFFLRRKRKQLDRQAA